jgi:hypothetical protein
MGNAMGDRPLCVCLPQPRASCCEPSYGIGLALMRGEVERRTAELVQQYEACTVCPQYLKGAHVAIARGEVDGGSLVLVSHINPRPRRQQCLYATNATHQSLIQQWRAPPLVRLLDVAAGGCRGQWACRRSAEPAINWPSHQRPLVM